MRVGKLNDVYAARDITALPGPKLAHTATHQAEVAARNVWCEMAGKVPDAFYYHEIDAIIDQGGRGFDLPQLWRVGQKNVHLKKRQDVNLY